MKTYESLYPHIHSFETLYQAYRAARRGNRECVAAAHFEFDLKHNLLCLQTKLRERSMLDPLEVPEIQEKGRDPGFPRTRPLR